MTAKLIQIGNSKGVRLPKALIEQAGLKTEVTIRVEGQSIIIEPQKKHPRAGWDEAFKKAIAEHGNELTDEDREWIDAPLSQEADKELGEW
jgi:antitoxin MazE